MILTIFDGSTVQPCTVEQAKTASNEQGLTWIDVRMEPGDDPTTGDAAALFTAVNVNPDRVQQALSAGLATDFDIHASSIRGVLWLDDGNDSPSSQALFSWDQTRLVTIRSAGDAAITQVRQRISDRANVLSKDPSTVVGVVLQLFLATVQSGLTELMIKVGALDMKIIETATPDPAQTAALTGFRQQVSDIALRFPMYVINVQSALIDPAPVPGLDDGGMSQLQQFLTACQATEGLITNLLESIKNAAQDIQAQVQNFQGQRINVLTIVTMIFLPITFITGYFGMNFTWLDNQLNSYGSWMVLGVIMPIGLVIGAVFLLGRSGYQLPKVLKRKHRTPSTPTGASPASSTQAS